LRTEVVLEVVEGVEVALGDEEDSEVVEVEVAEGASRESVGEAYEEQMSSILGIYIFGAFRNDIGRASRSE